MAGSGTSGLFGAVEQIVVERGLAEFRCGRPVILNSAEGRVAALPVDGMTDEALVSFRRMCAPARPHLLITARRARALGLEGAGPTGLAVGDLHDRAAIFSLAADAQVTRRLDVVPTGKTAAAAIELAKLAHRLPALLIGDGGAAAVSACDPPLMRVAAGTVAQFRKAAIERLTVAAEATIPLNGGSPARFVIFRDGTGGAPIAVIVGK